jgi:acyl-CoA thioesterase-2
VLEPIGDFARDTAIEGADGRYRGVLSDNWELWGPAGGYVSAVALRAAGEASRFDRPASYSCSYFSVAAFGPIDIEVVTLRSAKRAEALRVTLVQDGRPFCEAAVWTVDSGLAGLEHDTLPMPDVPGPDGLRAWNDVAEPDQIAFPRFWSNIEERMLFQWFGKWQERPAGPPVRESWLRFRPQSTFDDPYLDAARSVVLIETLGWPAAMMAYTGQETYVAPTIELSARFHRLEPRSEWLLCSAEAPIASDGLIGSTARVWSRDGKLIASGGQTMLFRPARRG